MFLVGVVKFGQWWRTVRRVARRVQNGGGFESRSLFLMQCNPWVAADLQAPRTLHTRLAIAETDTDGLIRRNATPRGGCTEKRSLAWVLGASSQMFACCCGCIVKPTEPFGALATMLRQFCGGTGSPG